MHTLPRSVLRFPAPEEMLERMRAAGFREVSWTPYTFGIAGLVSRQEIAQAVCDSRYCCTKLSRSASSTEYCITRDSPAREIRRRRVVSMV